MRKSVAAFKTAGSHCFVHRVYARPACCCRPLGARVPSKCGIPGHHHARVNLPKPTQGNSCNGGGWNDRDCPDGSMTVCCSPKAAFVYGDDEPLDPCLALWWLTVECPRLYRHALKHVSTSLVRNIDMLVDTHVHPSVGATRGRIPRLHARLHTSERGSDPQLRFRSSISPPAITDFPLDGLRCLSPRNMTRMLSIAGRKAIRVWPSNRYSKGYPPPCARRHRVTRHLLV